MEASITLRQNYAIGIIIDDSLKLSDLIKVGNLFNFIISNQNENNKNDNDYTLKNTDTKIKIYIGVARKVPQRIKDKLQELTSGDLAPSNIKVIYFEDNKDYAKQEIEQRITQWALEDGNFKIWIVDPNSDTSGNLLSKFK